jgi:truncated hemoglobin YjbI
MPATLFERIGGEAAVKKAVAMLYNRLLSDPKLSYFFADIDIDTLRHSQMGFVMLAFGSPEVKQKFNLREKHARLIPKGLNDKHFDLVAMHFKEVLKELKVPAPLIDEAVAIVETTRNEVLNR